MGNAESSADGPVPGKEQVRSFLDGDDDDDAEHLRLQPTHTPPEPAADDGGFFSSAGLSFEPFSQLTRAVAAAAGMEETKEEENDLEEEGVQRRASAAMAANLRRGTLFLPAGAVELTHGPPARDGDEEDEGEDEEEGVRGTKAGGMGALETSAAGLAAERRLADESRTKQRLRTKRGSLTSRELAALYTVPVKYNYLFGAREADRLQQTFAYFDRSTRRGAVGKDALRKVMASFGVENEGDRVVDAIFAEADLNQDGEIDFAEFCETMAKAKLSRGARASALVALSVRVERAARRREPGDACFVPRTRGGMLVRAANLLGILVSLYGGAVVALQKALGLRAGLAVDAAGRATAHGGGASLGLALKRALKWLRIFVCEDHECGSGARQLAFDFAVPVLVGTAFALPLLCCTASEVDYMLVFRLQAVLSTCLGLVLAVAWATPLDGAAFLVGYAQLFFLLASMGGLTLASDDFEHLSETPALARQRRKAFADAEKRDAKRKAARQEAAAAALAFRANVEGPAIVPGDAARDAAREEAGKNTKMEKKPAEDVEAAEPRIEKNGSGSGGTGGGASGGASPALGLDPGSVSGGRTMGRLSSFQLASRAGARLDGVKGSGVGGGNGSRMSRDRVGSRDRVESRDHMASRDRLSSRDRAASADLSAAAAAAVGTASNSGATAVSAAPAALPKATRAGHVVPNPAAAAAPPASVASAAAAHWKVVDSARAHERQASSSSSGEEEEDAGPVRARKITFRISFQGLEPVQSGQAGLSASKLKRRLDAVKAARGEATGTVTAPDGPAAGEEEEGAAAGGGQGQGPAAAAAAAHRIRPHQLAAGGAAKSGAGGSIDGLGAAPGAYTRPVTSPAPARRRNSVTMSTFAAPRATRDSAPAGGPAGVTQSPLSPAPLPTSSSAGQSRLSSYEAAAAAGGGGRGGGGAALSSRAKLMSRSAGIAKWQKRRAEAGAFSPIASM